MQKHDAHVITIGSAQPCAIVFSCTQLFIPFPDLPRSYHSSYVNRFNVAMCHCVCFSNKVHECGQTPASLGKQAAIVVL